MDERHVPPIGLRYWVIFLLVSILGGQIGDLAPVLLPFSILGRMIVLAMILAAIFVVERYDNRSSTDAYYWLAVLTMQIGAVRLNDFSALQLGMDRLELVGALIVLLVTTIIVARSDESHLFATMQLERPGTAARPLADVAHWLGLIVASILGAAASDLFTLTFAMGPVLPVMVFSAGLAVLFYLQRRSRPDRLHAFWLTTTLARADAIAIGDWLIKGPHLHLDLGLATVVTGILVVILVAFWRAPPAHV